MAFQNVVGTRLGQGAITTSYTAFYTVPPNTRAYIKDFDICNTTSSTAYVYVSFVQSGETVGTTNAILYNAMIPPYSTLQWSGTQILNAGATVQVKALATGCTITVSGGEAV
jgi:hypothetical protein